MKRRAAAPGSREDNVRGRQRRFKAAPKLSRMAVTQEQVGVLFNGCSQTAAIAENPHLIVVGDYAVAQTPKNCVGHQAKGSYLHGRAWKPRREAACMDGHARAKKQRRNNRSRESKQPPPINSQWMAMTKWTLNE